MKPVEVFSFLAQAALNQRLITRAIKGPFPMLTTSLSNPGQKRKQAGEDAL